MPKYHIISLLFAPVDNWIKNVYSLRTKTGTTSDELHTPNLFTHQFTFPTVHNSRLTPLFVQAFASPFYTAKISRYHPLDRQLYPQSTPPINKKKKEKLERNT
ncbi:MAG: hypothetical protein JWN12_455 [Candidatus Saccharibacteria bacterium]|nr:hypothetical protein [Candidatus Saccharibacteria bacterium]